MGLRRDAGQMASGGGGGTSVEGAASQRGVGIWEGGGEPTVLSGTVILARGAGLSSTTLTSIEGRWLRGVICSTATPTVPSFPQHSDRTRFPQNDWNNLTTTPTIAIMDAEAPPAFRASSKFIYIGHTKYRLRKKALHTTSDCLAQTTEDTALSPADSISHS